MAKGLRLLVADTKQAARKCATRRGPNDDANHQSDEWRGSSVSLSEGHRDGDSYNGTSQCEAHIGSRAAAKQWLRSTKGRPSESETTDVVLDNPQVAWAQRSDVAAKQDRAYRPKQSHAKQHSGKQYAEEGARQNVPSQVPLCRRVVATS
jgi:hypothetical protein